MRAAPKGISIERVREFNETSRSERTFMEVERIIDKINGVLRTRITGEISLREAAENMRNLESDASYSPKMSRLVDLRDATSNMTADEILTLAQMIKSGSHAGGHSRRAVLVSTEIMYGLYRMLDSFTAGSTIEYRAFENEGEALTWLQGTRARAGQLVPEALIPFRFSGRFLIQPSLQDLCGYTSVPSVKTPGFCQ